MTSFGEPPFLVMHELVTHHVCQREAVSQVGAFAALHLLGTVVHWSHSPQS